MIFIGGHIQGVPWGIWQNLRKRHLSRDSIFWKMPNAYKAVFEVFRGPTSFILDEFYFKWLENSVTEIWIATSIPLIINHLKRKFSNGNVGFNVRPPIINSVSLKTVSDAILVIAVIEVIKKYLNAVIEIFMSHLLWCHQFWLLYIFNLGGTYWMNHWIDVLEHSKVLNLTTWLK